MEPRIIKQNKEKENAVPVILKCNQCNMSRSSDDFLNVKPFWFKYGKFTVCNPCLKERFIKAEWNWEELDTFCQGINIPFIPIEFERLREINNDDVLPVYVKMFAEVEYEQLGWKPYHDIYMDLKRKKKLDMELPVVRDSYYEDLKTKWGHEYDREGLYYLENLFNGMMSSQNINGALQIDQARKMCKISWAIDELIRSGENFDKMMSSYEKMAKIANFTSKNLKGDSDFSSMGEVVAWLERREWLNPHFTDANQDIVDELIKSTQTFAQRLYINETGLGEEIEERIEQLKLATELEEKALDLVTPNVDLDEDFFDLSEAKPDLEEHENKVYNELMVDDVLDSDTAGV